MTASSQRETFASDQLNAGLGAGVDHLVAFLDGQPHRLLEHHVLAGLCGGDDEVAMRGVGRRDDDGVDVLPGEQRLGGRFEGDAVLVGELGGSKPPATATSRISDGSSPMATAWIRLM